MNTLLLCPFCGGDNIEISRPHSGQPLHYVAICVNAAGAFGCGASGNWELSEKDAIRKWNTRVLVKRPHIHNIRMLRGISAVVLEYSGNEELAENVRKWLSAPSVGAGVGEHAAGVSSQELDALDWLITQRYLLPETDNERFALIMELRNRLRASPQVEQVSAVQESFGDETPLASTQGHVAKQKCLDPELVTKAQEKELILLWRCSGWLDGLADRLAGLSARDTELLRYYANALNDFAERIRPTRPSVGRGNENQGADQVSENPCAVQGQWTPKQFYRVPSGDDKRHGWFIGDMKPDFERGTVGNGIRFDQVEAICNFHNASLRDDKKKDLGSETLAASEHSTREGQKERCPACGSSDVHIWEQWSTEYNDFTGGKDCRKCGALSKRWIGKGSGERLWIPSVVDGTAAHPALSKPNPPAPVPLASEVEEEKKQELGEPGAI